MAEIHSISWYWTQLNIYIFIYVFIYIYIYQLDQLGIPAILETRLPLQRPSPAWNALELLAHNRRLLKVDWSYL